MENQTKLSKAAHIGLILANILSLILLSFFLPIHKTNTWHEVN